MKPYLLFLYLFSITFSAIMAFLYRKAMKRRGIFILFPYLTYVAIQELVVFFYRLNNPNGKTGITINCYMLVTVLVFTALFHSIPFTKPIKRMIILLVSVYLALTIITFTFLQSVHSVGNYTITGGGLVVSSFAIFFLLFYFGLDDLKREQQWRPMVLVSIGVVFFFPVVNISQAFHDHLLNKKATVFGMPLYNIIPQVMSIFMYSCFARAFYLCKTKN